MFVRKTEDTNNIICDTSKRYFCKHKHLFIHKTSCDFNIQIFLCSKQLNAIAFCNLL